jgi:Zn-dependent membrane protease YugP
MLIIFLITLAVGLLAHWHLKRTYTRHSRCSTRCGYSGAEAAHEILRQVGITNVEVVEHEELLGDHYDPRHRRLVLSSANYHGTSPAALGVAAHECGCLDVCGGVCHFAAPLLLVFVAFDHGEGP